MPRVLVTGGTGSLGREVARRLLAAGQTVRIMSRGSRPAGQLAEFEWAQADLITGAGLAEAVAGSDVIVHAATQSFGKTYEVDVRGTRQLLEHARAAGVGRVLYISIVGIDRIPFRYYQHKLATEALIQASPIPWAVLRATQFHTLIDLALRATSRWPIMPLPTDFQCQPIDPGEVADRLCAATVGGETGQLPDIGGPEVLRIGEMARGWLAAHQLRRRVLPLPLPGTTARAFRQGANTCPDQRYGRVSWAQWLSRQGGGSS